MKKEVVKYISISDYYYDLPDDRIAKYPLEERDHSKLLCYKNGEIKVRSFLDVPELLPDSSLLIFNNTRVIHARILFKKPTGATVEVFCLSPSSPKDYAFNFEQTKEVVWSCMVGNAKRWKNENLFLDLVGKRGKVRLTAQKLTTIDHEYEIAFSWDNPDFSFSEILQLAGDLPIPPYLNRATEENDKRTYQTIYSQVEGSVAAPTAGLHFTNRVMERLSQKNISLSEVTLHVGAGTFRPVKTKYIGEHEMHTELISVTRDVIKKMINNNSPLIVVGTTSLRTIESLYYLGVKLQNSKHPVSDSLIVEQWEPYDINNNVLTPKESLKAILTYMDDNNLEVFIATTRIIIAPGYDFKFVDGLITNFHQPQSTLLLLVSAFVGNDWEHIYKYAMEHDFRFLSYGDSTLLWRDLK